MVGEGELQQDLIVKQMIKLVQLATALMSWWLCSWPLLWQVDGCTAGHCFEGLMVVQLATVLTSWWLYSWPLLTSWWWYSWSLFWRPFVELAAVF
jgi:hypothetical protein